MIENIKPTHQPTPEDKRIARLKARVVAPPSFSDPAEEARFQAGVNEARGVTPATPSPSPEVQALAPVQPAGDISVAGLIANLKPVPTFEDPAREAQFQAGVNAARNLSGPRQ
jgi:hypothetical protein